MKTHQIIRIRTFKTYGFSFVKDSFWKACQYDADTDANYLPDEDTDHNVEGESRGNVEIVNKPQQEQSPIRESDQSPEINNPQLQQDHYPIRENVQSPESPIRENNELPVHQNDESPEHHNFQAPIQPDARENIQAHENNLRPRRQAAREALDRLFISNMLDDEERQENDESTLNSLLSELSIPEAFLSMFSAEDTAMMVDEPTEPVNIHEALFQENWVQSMSNEINQLKDKGTYEVVDRPSDRKVVKSVWHRK